MELPKPYIYLHRRGGPRDTGGPRFRIIAWSQGEAQITPKGASAPILIPILRLYIQRLDKPTNAPYYDISSSRLQAQLLGYLRTQSYAGKEFSIRAVGRKPKKVLGLSVRPIGG